MVHPGTRKLPAKQLARLDVIRSVSGLSSMGGLGWIRKYRQQLYGRFIYSAELDCRGSGNDLDSQAH